MRTARSAPDLGAPPTFRTAVRSLFAHARIGAFVFSLDGTVFAEAAGGDGDGEDGFAETLDLLGRLAAASGGAVAVLGEAPFADIDRRLAPLRLPGSAAGGLELRHGDGSTTRLRREGDLDPVRRLLERRLDGAAFRDEGLSIVLTHGDHVEAEAEAKAAAREAVALAPAMFAARTSRGATRIGFTGASLGHGLHRHMGDPAAVERIPIVFGGGRGDDEVYAAARAFGGTSIEVGGRTDHAADVALPTMNDVRWLMRDLLAELGEA